MIVSGSTIAESHIFNILIEISLPWALLISNDLIILLISLLTNLTDDSLVKVKVGMHTIFLFIKASKTQTVNMEFHMTFV